MQNRTIRTLLLAAVILALLVAVIVIAATLDRGNTVDGPADHGGSTASTHNPPDSTESDMLEGSMGLGDNPFID